MYENDEIRFIDDCASYNDTSEVRLNFELFLVNFAGRSANNAGHTCT